jgi:hypothetical protein
MEYQPGGSYQNGAFASISLFHRTVKVLALDAENAIKLMHVYHKAMKRQSWKTPGFIDSAMNSAFATLEISLTAEQLAAVFPPSSVVHARKPAAQQAPSTAVLAPLPEGQSQVKLEDSQGGFDRGLLAAPVQSDASLCGRDGKEAPPAAYGEASSALDRIKRRLRRLDQAPAKSGAGHNNEPAAVASADRAERGEDLMAPRAMNAAN